MVDGYATERRYNFTVENAGLQMTYEGTHRPLAACFEGVSSPGEDWLQVEMRSPSQAYPPSQHVWRPPVGEL
jgi:hypothetical protein